jgi:polysaccharide export outer membrane protein
MLFRAISIFALAGLAITGALNAQNAPAEPPRQEPAPSAYATTQMPAETAAPISPDDLVTIEALNVEEISKAWRVGGSGDLSLPIVGRIHAAGMTVDQLEQELTARLKQFVRNPQVTVFISEFRGHPVTVSGAVEKPGVVQLQGPASLFDVLVDAGGPKDAGATLTLTRNRDYGVISYPDAKTSADGAYSVAEVPLKDVAQKDTAAANIAVLPYDVITVSKDDRRRRLVYVAGEVNRPGAIELVNQDKVSLSQALAMAGGLTRLASSKKTILRHVDKNGMEVASIHVNAHRILDGQEKDLPLRDGDILIVPTNRLAVYTEAMTSTAISSSVVILGRL